MTVSLPSQLKPADGLLALFPSQIFHLHILVLAYLSTCPAVQTNDTSSYCVLRAASVWSVSIPARHSRTVPAMNRACAAGAGRNGRDPRCSTQPRPVTTIAVFGAPSPQPTSNKLVPLSSPFPSPSVTIAPHPPVDPHHTHHPLSLFSSPPLLPPSSLSQSPSICLPQPSPQILPLLSKSLPSSFSLFIPPHLSARVPLAWCDQRGGKGDGSH